MQEAPHAEWEITLDASDVQAVAVLEQDRVWNCFALADLATPFRAYSQVAIARRNQGASAACLIVRHPAFSVVSPYGPEAGVAAILARLALPGRALIQALPAHLPLLERFYGFPAGGRELLRMAVSAATFRPPAALPDAPVGWLALERDYNVDNLDNVDGMRLLPRLNRLTPADTAALIELYAVSPDNLFRPDLLEHGVFYGVRAFPTPTGAGAGATPPARSPGAPAGPAPARVGTVADGTPSGDIIAAGGTHVVAPTHGIAVLGSILTHPAARRRGYGMAITAALVADLLSRGCRDVVLNVVAENALAISIYERLGFQTHARYWTGQGELV